MGDDITNGEVQSVANNRFIIRIYQTNDKSGNPVNKYEIVPIAVNEDDKKAFVNKYLQEVKQDGQITSIHLLQDLGELCTYINDNTVPSLLRDS